MPTETLGAALSINEGLEKSLRQLGDMATTWLLKNDRSQQTTVTLYPNLNESLPRVSVFRTFEEGLQHTQIFRMYVGIL